MPEPTRFPNAPIVEAVLDIRVRLPKESDLARLEQVGDNIRERYPQKRVRKAWQGELRFTPDQGLEVGQKSGDTIGFSFASDDTTPITRHADARATWIAGLKRSRIFS